MLLDAKLKQSHACIQFWCILTAEPTPLCYFILFPLVSDTVKGFDSNKTLQAFISTLVQQSAEDYLCKAQDVLSPWFYCKIMINELGCEGKKCSQTLNSAPCWTVFFTKQASAFEVPGIACRSCLLTEGCWRKGGIHPEAGNSAGIWDPLSPVYD